MATLRPTLLWPIAVVTILAMGAWVRLVPIPEVFVEDQVLPAAGDASYHLHRIERTLESYPHVPVNDRFLNWPAGASCPWPAGFDLMAASLVKLAGAEDDPQYWFKMKEASKAFTKALKKLTQKQGHDLIGEIDSMYREDGNEIPDITDAVKKIIEDAGGSTT